jgi:hypothetical protein
MKPKEPGNARAIEKRLAERFALTHVHVQSFCRPGAKDQILQIDFSGIGVRMTVAGLRRLCDDVSAAVGGALYGTVNLDYSGDVVSVEIMVELE